ncbi:WD40 repeat domain-containing protein, partial [Candidatus Kapabacteria bacterium]|nr:WD40 repeat domain-containing protein [Candidatus Kapabacteria bacterium]
MELLLIILSLKYDGDVLMHKILIFFLAITGYLQAQTPEPNELLAEPDTIWTRDFGGITYVEFSPDGSRVIVSQRNEYYIYDSFTGEEITKHIFSNPFYRARFVFDSYHVLTTGGEINNLIDSTRVELKDENISLNNGSHIYAVNHNLNYLYSYDNDNNLIIWDLEANKLVEYLDYQIDIRHIEISPDNKWLVISQNTHGDGHIWLYDISGDGLLKHKKHVYSSEFMVSVSN